MNIVQKEDPVLREKAEEVPVADIGSAKIRKLIQEMRTALASQKDGVAIAAPQVGASLRIFVVAGALLAQADKTYTGSPVDLIFINPVITRRSREKMEVEEGCLSVRWLYGKIRRAARVTLQAYNEEGEKIERGASGLLAQIFQHETDHLEGTLFTDHAKEVWEMSDEEIAELQKK
ncbi:MAG: peptide deformylase [Candidatus Taylorbacteria bacterium]